MSGAHIHLLLTHVPVLGILFGTAILAYAWIRKRNEPMQIALATFVVSAVAATVVYLTGEAAEEVVEGMAGVSHAVIERHEEAAVLALVAALLMGTLSAVGLWLSRRAVPRWFATMSLVAALGTTGVMAWTANLGGQINHPEIRSDFAEQESSLAETSDSESDAEDRED